MKNETLNYIIIFAGAILLVGLGIRGIARKVSDLKKKELRKADTILAWGELVSGIMYLGYLVYALCFK